MASVTSSGSGLWSVVVNANDGDSVTIASGHTVVFDVDQSAWTTGLAALVVTGNLKFKSDSYTCLMLATNVNITGTGVFGNPASDPVQRPAVGTTHRSKIIMKGLGQIQVTSVDHEGWIPSLNSTALSENAALNATEIPLTENLGLQVGDEIEIGCSNDTGVQAEANKGIYTVQSYNSETKIVTLTSGLNKARLAGDFVAWVSRTIQIERTPASATRISSTVNAGGILKGVRLVGTQGVMSHGWTITGCTLQAGYYGLATNTSGHILQDCTSINNANGGIVYGTSGSTVIDCIGFNSGDAPYTIIYTNYLYRCKAQNNASMLKSGFNVYLSQCKEKNSSVAAIDTPYECVIYDGEFNSAVQIANYRGVTTRKWIDTQSWNHNDIEGNFRAWMKGGYVYLDTTTKHNGNDTLRFVIEENTPMFREYFIYAPANKKITLKLDGYKDFTDGTIKVQVIDPKYDPMIDTNQIPLAEIEMDNIKDSWVPIKLSYKSDYTQYVILRILVQNTSGNAWFDISKLEMMLAARKMILMS